MPRLNKLTVFSDDQDENENVNNQTITNSKHETSVTSQEQGIDTVDSGRFDELSLNAITPSKNCNFFGILQDLFRFGARARRAQYIMQRT